MQEKEQKKSKKIKKNITDNKKSGQHSQPPLFLFENLCQEIRKTDSYKNGKQQ